MKLISIVVPMYFEEKVAEECYKRLTTVVNENNINYELIFINDGSRDKTQDILESIASRDNRVKVVSFSRNFGHQIAITAGMNRANGDAIVVIDADLQDPPEIIPDMLKLWENGYDVVYAKRKRREGETLFKLFTAKMFYRVLNKMSTIEIPMDTGDFRLIDRKVAEALKNMPEQNRFVRGMVSWVGFKQISIEYERKERFAGETKYPLKKMIKLAKDGIISFSAKPLIMIEYLGAITVILSLGILIFSIVIRAFEFKNIVIGWSSVMIAMTLLGGVQLISIGILGEYISRIYDESRKRPLYIIDKEINLREKYKVKNDINIEKQLQKKVG